MFKHLRRVRLVMPALLGFLAIASQSFAVMDFTGITVDSASALAGALIVIGGYAAVWGIKLVIGVFKK